MPNGTYGGVRGRKTKVGGKLLLRFPPTRLPFSIPQPMVAEFHPTRTNRDTAGQIRTALAARPNIAYLVATFGRDYSRNH